MRKTLLLIVLLQLALFTAQAADVKIGHLKVHYSRTGKGPSVLFLHGGYLDLHQWDREVAMLKSSHTAVCIDLPGHGLTTGTDTTLKIAEVLRSFLDSLHIRRTAVVGLSLGGSCALDLALAYPERISKLVLVSSGLSGWSGVMQLDTLSERLFVHSDSVFAQHDKAAITAMFTNTWCDGPYRRPEAVDQTARRYVYRTVAKNLDGRHAWPVFDRAGAARRAASLRMPVLLFAGDRDVPFIRSVAKYLHTQIKTSKLIVIKGAAHMIDLEKPKQFDKVLVGFLN